jgi:general secretion pathway protein E
VIEQNVVDQLVRTGKLARDALARAEAVCAEQGGSITRVLVSTSAVTEDQLLAATAEQLGFPVISEIDPETIDPELSQSLPIAFAKQHRVLPLRREDDMVVVAVANPLDTTALDDVRTLLGAQVSAVVAPGEAIVGAINAVYDRKATDDDLGGDEKDQEDELTDLIEVDDDAPIIRWVNSLFFNAQRERASDIHIEPGEREVIVRYRIDGVLHEVRRANKGFLPGIISRVKIMAGLNIAEKRLPQDGRIGLKIAGKSIDIRVSTIPTSQGERVVLRLLDKTSVLHDLTDLGFSRRNLSTIEGMIVRPHGIILVTGPTGSGKTTTLYAALSKINTPDRNILTVEDPVEYDIKGISQMPVNPKINLTFATGLRAFLRQDPDVIMVGEIRDRETAEIAIHASLTGHLVLSTIHTNDAAGAVTRLVEMGIEPFLVSSSLLCIMAQRLVRILCPDCRVAYEGRPEQLRDIGIDVSTLSQRMSRDVQNQYTLENCGGRPLTPSGLPLIYRANGCERCQGTGYLGRTGIHEVMPVTDGIRALVLKNSDSNALKRHAMSEGMQTLRDEGAAKVLSGITTAEEVARVTQEDVE